MKIGNVNFTGAMVCIGGNTLIDSDSIKKIEIKPHSGNVSKVHYEFGNKTETTEIQKMPVAIAKLVNLARIFKDSRGVGYDNDIIDLRA